LKEKYDINLGVRQCQRLFDKLDFRLRKHVQSLQKAMMKQKQNIEKTSTFSKSK